MKAPPLRLLSVLGFATAMVDYCCLCGMYEVCTHVLSRFPALVCFFVSFCQVLQAFQTDPGVKVLLISLKAGGVALNLTVANHIFLMDP